MAAYIQGRNVSLTFRPPNRAPVPALGSFDIDVAEGEFVSIVGPSGCGKSTFLNILLGLIKPDSGEILMHGKKLSGPGTDRAMVFQDFGLLAVAHRGAQYRARARAEESAQPPSAAPSPRGSRAWSGSPASNIIIRTNCPAA